MSKHLVSSRPMSFACRLFTAIKENRKIRSLFHGKTLPPSNPSALPRDIFIFWDAGIDRAPDLVKYCVQSWVDINPNWSVHFLDQKAANEFVDRACLPKEITTTQYSDILRVNVLAQRGGIWVDSTCLCLKPLDDWILSIFNQTDFFAFYRPGRDRIIASWFLAASQESEICHKWRTLISSYWQEKKRSKPAYFWVHYLFEYLVRYDGSSKRIWESVPKLSAERPHILQKYLRGTGVAGHDLRRMHHVPLQKLSIKGGFSLVDVTRTLQDLN